jgi:hypothetical protein
MRHPAVLRHPICDTESVENSPQPTKKYAHPRISEDDIASLGAQLGRSSCIYVICSFFFPLHPIM